MSKRCGAYQCANESMPGWKLCGYHYDKRRAMQAATRAQPDCVDCRNKAPLGSTRCRSCQETHDSNTAKAQAEQDFHSEFYSLQNELKHLDCSEDARQWLGRLLELVGTRSGE